MSMRFSRVFALGVAALAAAGSLTGRAEAADPASCETVRFADVGWTDITSTTALASVMLEGLGYQPTNQILALPVTFASLKNNDIDVFLGLWMPSMEADFKPYREDGSIELLRTNLEGAKYTLAVPTYLSDKGLKSFADITKFKDQLDSKIYGIEPGNDGNRLVQKMLDDKAFGLDGFEIVESSEQGMLAEVARKQRSEEPIVFLGWAPHPMNTNFNLSYLEGGDDYFGPNFGGATVSTVVRKGYVGECPNVGRFLTNLAFNLEVENEVMKAILDEGKEPQAAAEGWIEDHPQAIEPWLAGVTALDGSDGLAAVKQHLGL